MHQQKEKKPAKNAQTVVASGKALVKAAAASSATLTLFDEAAYDPFNYVLPGCAVLLREELDATCVEGDNLKFFDDKCASAEVKKTAKNTQTVVASGKALLEGAAASSASAEEVEPNAQTGYGPVEAKAAASATEEGKIPVKNAQTGKALVGAAAAASESVNSSAAGVDDNEVFGNSL